MKILLALATVASASVAMSLGGCTVSPARTEGSARVASNASAPATAVRKHRVCEFETGSHLCHYADDEEPSHREGNVSLQYIGTGHKGGL